MFDAISTNVVGKTCCHAQSWQPCCRGSVTGTLICDAMPQERRVEPRLMWAFQLSGDCGDPLNLARALVQFWPCQPEPINQSPA